MLRVLFLVPEFPSVSQTFVLNQIKGLVNAGVDVSVAALRPGTKNANQSDVDRYDVTTHITYLGLLGGRLKRSMRLLKVVSGLCIRRPGTVGCLARIIMRSEAAQPTSTYTLLASAAAIFDTKLDLVNFDALVCHFGPMGLLGLALRRTGVLQGRLVTVFHGVDMSAFLREHSEGVYSSLFAEGELFLPISERWQRRLVELGCPPERTAIHHMGVDPEQFPSHYRQWEAGEALHLLTVARLVDKKGVEIGIRAVANLLGATDTPIRYTIIGDGPLRSSLEGLVCKLGIQENVHFLGSQAHEVVVQYIEDAHILLAPSLVGADGDEEGIPVALMEALASRVPVIATHHSGIPELIHHGMNGWLVPEGDVLALSEAIKKATLSASMWPELTTAGRRTVEAEFNVHLLNDVLFQRLQELVSVGKDGHDSNENAFSAMEQQ